jgi:hypothetical protein
MPPTHVQHLRTHSKKVLMHLCCMLIGAELTFLIAIDRTSPRLDCQVTAILIEYFLLAAFMVCVWASTDHWCDCVQWMLVDAYVLYNAFVVILGAAQLHLWRYGIACYLVWTL